MWYVYTHVICFAVADIAWSRRRAIVLEKRQATGRGPVCTIRICTSKSKYILMFLEISTILLNLLCIAYWWPLDCPLGAPVLITACRARTKRSKLCRACFEWVPKNFTNKFHRSWSTRSGWWTSEENAPTGAASLQRRKVSRCPSRLERSSS